MNRLRYVTIMVPVSQWHIDNGQAFNCATCPVSLAIGDRTNMYVSTAGFSVRLWDGNTSYIWDTYLPCDVVRFMVTFDCGRRVEPFSFPLTVPVFERP